MGFTETVILGAGLSMDSFALSITNGMCAVKNKLFAAVMCALCFGLFQGSLTTLGYAVGSAFAEKIKAFDHFVVLILLGYIGIKMLLDSRRGGEKKAVLSPPVVFFSAFATSVDALTVGVGLAALDVSIVFVGAVMTLVSFFICFAGFLIGEKAGKRLGSSAQAVGGMVLIGLAVKIFVQHMFL